MLMLLSVACAEHDTRTQTVLGFQAQDDPDWVLIDEELRHVVEAMFHVVPSMRADMKLVVKKLAAWMAEQRAKKHDAVLLPLIAVKRLQEVSCSLC